MDLTLGVPLMGQKLDDFNIFLAGKYYDQINLNSRIRQTIYDQLLKIDNDDEVVVQAYKVHQTFVDRKKLYPKASKYRGVCCDKRYKFW